MPRGEYSTTIIIMQKRLPLWFNRVEAFLGVAMKKCMENTKKRGDMRFFDAHFASSPLQYALARHIIEEIALFFCGVVAKPPQ